MKNKRINLINPPQLQLYDPKAYQPLGLLYLGAILQRENANCRFVDMSDKKNYQIPLADAHLVTINSASYGATKEVVNQLDGFTVVGGFHPSIFPVKTKKELGVDSVVIGEAEDIIKDIVFEEKAGIFEGKPIRNLDAIPFPARNLVPRKELRHLEGIHTDTYKGDGAATTLISSRGCPFSCRFCSKSLAQTQYFRWRSPKNIYDEIKAIQERYDIHHFRFVDDCFTANKERVFELCALLEGLDIYWLCITRTDLLNKQLLDAMFDAGCREIHFGIETGSQRLLDLLNKKTTVEQNIKACRMAKSSGLKVKTFLMYNIPTETESDIEATKTFVREVKPDKWTLSKFRILPGSYFWNNYEKFDLEEPSLNSQWFYPEEDCELKEWLIKKEYRVDKSL